MIGARRPLDVGACTDICANGRVRGRACQYDMHNGMPDNISEDVPNSVPEDVPDDRPEDVPEIEMSGDWFSGFSFL